MSDKHDAQGETFAEWLTREMPAGIVIGDPAWWAPRIAAKIRATEGQAQTSAAVEGFVLAKQTVVEMPDGKKELGHTLLDGVGIFTSHNEVSKAIAELSLPLGWVSMTTGQLLPGWQIPEAPPADQLADSTDTRQAYWNNVASGLTKVAKASERAEADCNRKHSSLYVLEEVQELRGRLESLEFVVRHERHKYGYPAQPPSPPMPTWAPVLSEQEKNERERMIASGEIAF